MADTSVAITAGTGTPIRVLTGLGPGSADQQVVTLADQFGNLALADPDGTLGVDAGMSSLLLDSFDSGSLAPNWVTGGTVPSVSNGNAITNESTSSSAVSYMRSIGTFALQAQGYLLAAYQLSFETAATTNNTRWWGYGTNAATPSSVNPVLNGVVFMLDAANSGALVAAKWVNGTKTVIATLTRPSDGLLHKYSVWYKQSMTYWVIDGVTVASATFVNMTTSNNQYLIAGSANAATAPGAHSFSIATVSIADTEQNTKTIGDALSPWIRTTVKQSPTSQTNQLLATDNAMLVQALPPVSKVATITGSAASSTTLTLAAPGAGLRHYITSVTLMRYCSAATTGAASGFVTTSANTSFSWPLPSDTQPIGHVDTPVQAVYSSPVASTSQNAATSIVTPAVTATVYTITVTYFVAP